MALALKAQPRVIPTGSNKSRQKGSPKPMVAFRAPEDVMAYFARTLAPNADRSELIVKMLRVGRDLSESLGIEWWEIERRANVEKRSAGEIIADMVRATLQAERSKPKK